MSNEEIAIIAGAVGAAIGAFATNHQKNRQVRKEIVAGATKSALRRVEMYYRVRRREPNGSDDTKLRDQFHDIQEDNDYYISLLDIEAPWLGDAYRRFLTALKKDLQPLMHKAWAEKGQGPSAQIKDGPDVKAYVSQFTKDSRRLFNLIMRPLQRVRYTLRKLFKENPYESR